MPLELYLKKHLWAINALTVAVGAIFLAKATGHFLAARYLLDGTTPTHYTPLAAPASQEAVDFSAIVGRNVFCSTCTPATMPAAATQVAAASLPTGDLDDASAVKTSLPLTYVASFICFSDVNWSFATVTNNVDQTAGVYRIGSQLPSDYGWITDIEPDRVYFEHSGHLEFMPLITDPTAPGAVTPQPAAAAVAASPVDADMEKGVHKMNDFQYNIDRSLLEKVLTDTSVLAQEVRIIPSVDPTSGKPNGFKMYGIRPGTIMAAIGFENGDTISAINGNDISTPDKAFDVYTKVRNASIVTVSIDRGGTAHELDYSIQ
jgi:general secretion pathway protein C